MCCLVLYKPAAGSLCDSYFAKTTFPEILEVPGPSVFLWGRGCAAGFEKMQNAQKGNNHFSKAQESRDIKRKSV